MKFKDMCDEVHVDEKWFCICKATQSHMLVADEELPPDQFVKHKSHIVKVMFVCAQARPRKLSNGQWWDGKIGTWPVGHVELAEKPSSLQLTDRLALRSGRASRLTC